jgi:hypothetical protein
MFSMGWPNSIMIWAFVMGPIIKILLKTKVFAWTTKCQEL